MTPRRDLFTEFLSMSDEVIVGDGAPLQIEGNFASGYLKNVVDGTLITVKCFSFHSSKISSSHRELCKEKV
jgi:hypothetical protein